MNAEETLVSVQETARRLDISVNTVRRWIKAGKLDAIKIGRQWRIRNSEVKKLILEGTESQSGQEKDRELDGGQDPAPQAKTEEQGKKRDRHLF